MSLRRITSLTATLSFLVTTLTSIVLYVIPHGRVAYWADWHLWGLSKDQWGALHINVGFLFLFALVVHIYLNWKPLMLYLKDKAKHFKLFTADFNVALVITMVCTVGTYWELPPFSTVIEVGDNIKAKAAQKYGEPPYGHAELSTLQVFCKRVDLDAVSGLAALEQAGYSVEGTSETLSEIAERNGVSPQVLYEAMLDAAGVDADVSTTLPDSPVPGTGDLTIDELCEQYALDVSSVMQALSAAGLEGDPDTTIKAIGKANDTNPMAVYEAIRAAVQTP